MNIKILAEGGSMKPGPALSQKLGPAGINVNLVIQKINDATKEFEGLKVPVEVEVDTGTKTFEVKVFSPPVSELLKRELKVAKGSGMQKKTLVANASIEQIILVAKAKMQNLLCKDLKSAVKTVVGTCVSLGILVENKPASELEKDIEAGKYDKEIKEQRTQTPPEKKASLEKYFANVKAEQEKKLKLEQAAKEAAEAEKKAETEKAGTAPAAVAAPVAAAKPAEKAKEPAKKK